MACRLNPEPCTPGECLQDAGYRNHAAVVSAHFAGKLAARYNAYNRSPPEPARARQSPPEPARARFTCIRSPEPCTLYPEPCIINHAPGTVRPFFLIAAFRKNGRGSGFKARYTSPDGHGLGYRAVYCPARNEKSPPGAKDRAGLNGFILSALRVITTGARRAEYAARAFVTTNAERRSVTH